MEKMFLKSKGAIHYLRDEELDENMNYLKPQINKEKIVTFIVGGPNKYYDYNDQLLMKYFQKFKKFYK